jgi:hypothetical protein
MKFLQEGDPVPKGFVKGGLSKDNGLGGSKIYHHPDTKEIRYVRPGGKAPKGYLAGRPPIGKGKVRRVHNPITKEVKQVGILEPLPKGFIEGSGPTDNGKACYFRGRRFKSVKDCVEQTGINRYFLSKEESFRFA